MTLGRENDTGGNEYDVHDITKVEEKHKHLAANDELDELMTQSPTLPPPDQTSQEVNWKWIPRVSRL